MSLDRALRIRRLTVPNRVFLAPLAGVSDVPFRRICTELGAGLTFVEMLTANAVLQANRRTFRTMARAASETQLGVQVTGKEPEEIAAAAEVLDREGFDLIDVNMGCPVRKVVSKGWGSAILEEPDRLEAIMRTGRAATDRPFSAKIRLGAAPGSVTVEESADLIASSGADMITIHGRTRIDRYNRPVDLRAIRRGLDVARERSPGIVTVGNGDVLDRTAAYAMGAETGCDAVMVSRGALGNPWIFAEILDPTLPSPTLDEWMDVLFRHMAYHEEHYREDEKPAVMFRKHLLWYVTGFPGIRALREALSVVHTMEDAREQVRRFAAGLPRDLPRSKGGA